MGIEHVTRALSFDNLVVEVSVDRWICDDCGRRQAFHDVPTPYMEKVPTPSSLGWRLGYPMDDGEEQTCICPACAEKNDAEYRRKYAAQNIE